MTPRLRIAAVLLLLTPVPAAAFGEPPLPATEISKPVSLKDAANRGLVTLTSKGNYAGDGVAVDLKWKPLPGPTRVTLRIDFTVKTPATAKAGVGLAVKRGVAEMNRLARRGGAPQVRFDVQYTVSGRGAPQPPGYHQIDIVKNDDFRSFVEGEKPVNGVEGNTGTWSSSDLFNPTVFAHEALHLAGLPDRYDDYYFEPGTGRRVQVPDRGLNTRKEIDDWARGHVPPLRPGGRLESSPMAGAGCDIMGNPFAACRRLRPKDLRDFAGQAGVRLEAPAGDLLANKAGDQQNLGVGEPLNLFASRNGTARADGLVVYCVNFTRAIPVRGVELDVLGPASSLPGPGGAQLQAVLERIAALPRREGGTGERTGGQAAVWAVTDPSTPVSGDAAEILAAVGIPAAGGAGLPPVVNPNAATPGTAAVNPDGTLVPAPPEVPAPPAARIALERVSISRTVLRAGRVNRVELGLQVTGGGPLVLLRVERRAGTRWRTVGAFPPRLIGSGEVVLGLSIPRLRAGDYRVRVSGPFAARTAAFSVR